MSAPGLPLWERLTEPWRVALGLAWQSYCEGSLPIAAVVLDAAGDILSQGRNESRSVPRSEPNQVIGGRLAHAELNAILALDLSDIDPHTCELLTLVEPCPLCLGAVCMAGVKVIRYAARDSWAGSTNLLQASPYLRWKAIKAFPPEDGELEAVVHMLQVDAELKRGSRVNERVLAAWSTQYPAYTRLGYRLHASGIMAQMRAAGSAAGEVVARLAELLKEWGGG